MQKRRVGQTDIEVSVLGLGTVKFGRNEQVKYPEPFQLPDDKTIHTLLALALESGINLLDTAPAYGTSESRLGAFLKNKRHDFVLMSKVGEAFTNGQSHFDYQREAVMKSVDESLKRLQTDYLDILLIHSSGDDVAIIQDFDVFETCRLLKAAGKIRAFGFSSKTVAGGLMSIEASDCAMVTYNEQSSTEQIVIEKALQSKKGIFVKKAFGSGHLLKQCGREGSHRALKFVFQQKGVTSVIIGTIQPAHLLVNVRATNQLLGQEKA